MIVGLIKRTYENKSMYNIIDTGPQEGVCNWCGQFGGRGGIRKGADFTIITCADPPGKTTLQTSGGTFWGYFEM